MLASLILSQALGQGRGKAYAGAAFFPPSAPALLLEAYDHPSYHRPGFAVGLLACWSLGIAGYTGLGWLALRAATRRLERERGPLPKAVTPA